MSTYKILALNGSPRGKNSNTDKLLKSFLAGAEEAGAQTELVHLTELNIKDCLGCFSCWNKTPGCCVLKDDMPSLLEKIRDADLVVWGTPLYHFGMTARLKRVLERTLPLCKPYIVKRGVHYGHPSRYTGRRTKYMLVSNCGFPERHHFDALVEQFQHFSVEGGGSVGAILCPAGEVMGHMDCGWYFDAVKHAGQEVVNAGRISEETAAVLAKDFIPLEVFLENANACWNVPGDTAPTLKEAMSGTWPGDGKAI